jgi:hypothetical protein
MDQFLMRSTINSYSVKTKLLIKLALKKLKFRDKMLQKYFIKIRKSILERTNLQKYANVRERTRTFANVHKIKF